VHFRLDEGGLHFTRHPMPIEALGPAQEKALKAAAVLSHTLQKLLATGLSWPYHKPSDRLIRRRGGGYVVLQSSEAVSLCVACGARGMT